MDSWFILPSATKGLDLLFISLFIGFVLFAIGSFIKWVKPTKVESTKNGFSFEFKNGKRVKTPKINKDEKDLNTKISLQACLEETPSFKNELKWVVSKSIRFGYEMCQLKEVTIVRIQMNMAQVKVDLVKNLFLKDFSEKVINLKKLNPSIPNFTYEIFNEFISRIIKIQILDEMKRLFKENHLLNYSNEDYEDIYCRDRIRVIITNLRMAINNNLPDNMNPSVVEVIEILNKYETQIYSFLKEGFIEAREIAYKYNVEEEKRKEIFDKEILEAVGVENASRSGK